MGRSPSSDESGLKKGPWTPEEDHKLIQHIEKHGHGSWRALPKLAGLNRCGKSCRLRWTNYLRPDIKRGKFSPEEEQAILNLHAILGNKWSAIASNLPGRTDNEIKNYWNTHLKKKLIQMGFDPMTHRPRTDIFSSLPQLIALAKLKELMDQQPWDDHSIRLQQAEAINMAKLQCLQQFLQPTPPFLLDLTSNNNNNMNNNTTTTTTTLDMDPLSVVPPLDNCGQTQYSRFGEQAVHVPFNEPNQQIPSMVQHGGESTSQLHKAVSFSQDSCVLPPLTDYALRNINGGDACSTLSYDPCGTASSSLWSDLLVDDSFINQFD